MKESLPGETYSKSYMAIPITESPLFRWVQSINGNKSFYHMTLLLMGKITEPELPKIKNVMESLPRHNGYLPIIPEKLGFLGDKGGIFVLKIKKTDELEKIREILEKALPENPAFNHSFSPHITIKRAKWGQFNKHDIGRLLDIYDRSKFLDPFEAKTIGLYYRTEEGATALLISEKI